MRKELNYERCTHVEQMSCPYATPVCCPCSILDVALLALSSPMLHSMRMQPDLGCLLPLVACRTPPSALANLTWAAACNTHNERDLFAMQCRHL